MRRLIIFIVIFALFLAFIVFNISNKSDVSFGFKTFKDVPVYVSAFFSFVLGMLFTAPIVFSVGRKRKNASLLSSSSRGKNHKGKKIKIIESGTDSAGSGDYPGTDNKSKENSYYGID